MPSQVVELNKVKELMGGCSLGFIMLAFVARSLYVEVFLNAKFYGILGLSIPLTLTANNEICTLGGTIGNLIRIIQ